jgi:uncharacterized protein
LVVALEDMPPEGLARPLNLSPVVLAALLAEDGGEPPSLVSDLTGTLRLRRLGARLEVRGSFRVEAGLVCDRCLAPATLVLTGEIEESPFLAAADGRSEQAEEDVLVVTDGQVDLAGLLAESFWLAWPYRFICRPDCAGLCPTCGADLNRGACGCFKPV